MSARGRRLLLPVAFVATTGSSCCIEPPRGACDVSRGDECLPDGGYICQNRNCYPGKNADGGYTLAGDGVTIQCLC